MLALPAGRDEFVLQYSVSLLGLLVMLQFRLSRDEIILPANAQPLHHCHWHRQLRDSNWGLFMTSGTLNIPYGTIPLLFKEKI